MVHSVRNKWLFVLILVPVVVVVGVLVWDMRSFRDDSGLPAASMSSDLRQLLILAEINEASTGDHAPVRSSKFVQWLLEGLDVQDDREGAFRRIDAAGESIVDEWGSEVVVLAKEGRLWALGSAGPNGRWENGGGDDILVGRDWFSWQWK